MDEVPEAVTNEYWCSACRAWFTPPNGEHQALVEQLIDDVQGREAGAQLVLFCGNCSAQFDALKPWMADVESGRIPYRTLLPAASTPVWRSLTRATMEPTKCADCQRVLLTDPQVTSASVLCEQCWRTAQIRKAATPGFKLGI